MKSDIPVTQDELTRQERLCIWMQRVGCTKASVARAVQVSPMAVTRWLLAEHLPSWRVRQLVEFGIPKELLPQAKDIASGPKLGSRKRLPASYPQV